MVYALDAIILSFTLRRRFLNHISRIDNLLYHQFSSQDELQRKLHMRGLYPAGRNFANLEAIRLSLLYIESSKQYLKYPEYAFQGENQVKDQLYVFRAK